MYLRLLRNIEETLIEWQRVLNKFIGERMDPNKFGTGTSYSEFESDGTYHAVGDATTFDDMLGDITRLRVVGVGIAFDDNENALNFQQSANMSDYCLTNYQFRHRWKSGSAIKPHIHFEQAQNQVPNFLIRYRWQVNGGTKSTTWNNFVCNKAVFPYTAGTLNQIAHSTDGITPSTWNISDILEIRIFRDNPNGSSAFSSTNQYTADALVTAIDVHIEEDTLGSRTEYSK